MSELNPFLRVAIKLCRKKTVAQIYAMETLLQKDWTHRERLLSSKKIIAKYVSTWWKQKKQVLFAKKRIQQFIREKAPRVLKDLSKRRALRIIRIYGYKLIKGIRKTVQGHRRLKNKLKKKKSTTKKTPPSPVGKNKLSRARDDVNYFVKKIPLGLSSLVTYNPGKTTDLIVQWSDIVFSNGLNTRASWLKMVDLFKLTYPDWDEENPDIPIHELLEELHVFTRTADGSRHMMNVLLHHVFVDGHVPEKAKSKVSEYASGKRIARAWRSYRPDSSIIIGMVTCPPIGGEKEYIFGPLNGFNVPISFRLPKLRNGKPFWSPLIRINLIAVPLAFQCFIWGPFCLMSLNILARKIFTLLKKWVCKRRYTKNKI